MFLKCPSAVEMTIVGYDISRHPALNQKSPNAHTKHCASRKCLLCDNQVTSGSSHRWLCGRCDREEIAQRNAGKAPVIYQRPPYPPHVDISCAQLQAEVDLQGGLRIVKHIHETLNWTYL